MAVIEVFRSASIAMPRLLTGLLAAAVICVGAAGVVYFVQRRALFPQSTVFTRPSRGPAEAVTLPLGGALFLTPTPIGSEPAPLLLFMHGNAETADDWVDQFAEVRRRGWAVLLLEYPGYGGTLGSPSESSIVTAALAAYDWAAHDPRIDASRIVAYGRSLGTGAATQVATARPVIALVLESGFTSVRPLAARFLVPGFLVRDPFDNLAQLRKYRGPLLVFHGTEDRVIPVSHGQALAAAVPGAAFIALTCGHNDCPRPWPQLFTWLDAHASVRH